MTDIRLPSLGADMDAGTIVSWCVAPGDAVQKGDLIGEIETDKGVFDLDSRETGVVAELLIAPGTKVAVGTPIVRLREAGDAAAAPVAPETVPIAVAEVASPVTPAASAPSAARVEVRPTPSTPAPASRAHASPLARRIAAEHGLDLSGVTGTGVHGAISRADVERALAERAPHPAAASTASPAVMPPAVAPPAVAPPAATPTVAPAASPKPTPVAATPTDGLRRAIAAAVTRSKREIPHYYLEHDVDLHAALAWLAQHNAARAITERVLPAALLVRATVQALARFPDLNGTFEHDHFTPASGVHVGIITALRGGGLVAPVIADAQAHSLAELNAALLDLVQRSRAGALRTSELGGGTISITSLGERGVRSVYGVIYPPQVAIVGVGTISDRPWAVDGMLAVRPIITITLAADHRVSDGIRGAQFLSDIGRHLQAPEDA